MMRAEITWTGTPSPRGAISLLRLRPSFFWGVRRKVSATPGALEKCGVLPFVACTTRPRRSEHHMNYSMHIFLTLTTVCLTEVREAGDADKRAPATPELFEAVEAARQRLLQLVEDFKNQPIAPLRTQPFDHHVQNQLLKPRRSV